MTEDSPTINAPQAENNNQNPPLSPTQEGIVEDKKKTQEREMTLKQRKWLKKYLECGNATEAAMFAYDCNGNRETAAQIGWENIRKLDYSDFMEEAGITDKLFQEKIMEGLESSKQIGALILIDKDGTTIRTKENEGMIEVPDFLTRHKYLETALKLKKRLTDRVDLTSKDEKIEGLVIYRPEKKHE